MAGKKYRYKCPLCGWLAWSSTLRRGQPEFSFKKTESPGRRAIRNIEVRPWPTKWLGEVRERILDMLRYVLDIGILETQDLKDVLQEHEYQERQAILQGLQYDAGLAAVVSSAISTDIDIPVRPRTEGF